MPKGREPKPQDTRFNEINFITPRHFKDAQKYCYTKDIPHVEYVLGRKNMKEKLIYVQIMDNWEVKRNT